MKRYFQQNEWTVKRVDGTQHYCAYDSLGMNRYVVNGLKLGPVFINDEEVILDTWEMDGIVTETWKLKNPKGSYEVGTINIEE